MSHRIYNVFGALRVTSWLGAGSLFLVAPGRLAVGFFFVIAWLSVVGSELILTHPFDPAHLSQTDASGSVEVKILPAVPVQRLIVLANILGGAALYSVRRFIRHGTPRRPLMGILSIGLGPPRRGAGATGRLPGERIWPLYPSLAAACSARRSRARYVPSGVTGPGLGNGCCGVGDSLPPSFPEVRFPQGGFRRTVLGAAS
jgi:hypothetical protein